MRKVGSGITKNILYFLHLKKVFDELPKQKLENTGESRI